MHGLIPRLSFLLTDDTLLHHLESTSYTIKKAHIDLLNTNFKEDSCDIKSFSRKRVSGSVLEAIIGMNREGIFPSLYALQQKRQPTTASAERSFSLLGKLLSKDRHFNTKNIRHYMIVFYNKKCCLWMYTSRFVYAFYLFILVNFKIKLYWSIKSISII